jgi:hypothetical protein
MKSIFIDDFFCNTWRSLRLFQFFGPFCVSFFEYWSIGSAYDNTSFLCFFLSLFFFSFTVSLSEVNFASSSYALAGKTLGS